MEFRIGGSRGVRFDLNRPMFAGMLLGVAGIALAGGILLGLLPGDRGWDAPLAGNLRWGDLALGIALLGMALYFVGRIVQIYDHLRRRP
jgi:hypothetical protein